MKPPSDPNEMPIALFNSDKWLREAVFSLGDFDQVYIHFTLDQAASETAGDTVGTWVVSVESGSRIAAGNGKSLPNVLWYVLEHAKHFSQPEQQKQEAIRKAALAKLTDEEKRALGVRP